MICNDKLKSYAQVIFAIMQEEEKGIEIVIKDYFPRLSESDKRRIRFTISKMFGV